MNDRDLYVLLRVVEYIRHIKRFDSLQVIKHLFDRRKISPSLCKRLRRCFTLGEGCSRVLMRFARECSLDDLISALESCGCQELAEKLWSERCVTNNANQTVFSLGRTGGTPTIVHSYYRQLKENVDNFAFADKEAFFTCVVQKLRLELAEQEMNSYQRKCCHEKLLTVHCMRIQTFKNARDRFSVIRDMHYDMALSPSSMENEALFNCKLGSTYSLIGDFQNAEKYLQSARAMCCAIQPSFLLYYIYLNEMFAKLAEYERTPTEEIKTTILYLGYTGIQAVSEEGEKTRLQWIRLFLTFMISCLLGVGIDFHELHENVSPPDRQQAKYLLFRFNELSDCMATRREMVYNFLMAKLLEPGNAVDALDYAKRALVMSEDGAYRDREKAKIQEFILKLKTHD